MTRMRTALAAACTGCLSLAAAVVAQAAVTTDLSMPFNLVVSVPCANGGAGDVLNMSGTLHEVATVVVDSNGGLHLTEHFNPQGLSGSGATGARYEGAGETSMSFHTTGALPLELTFRNTFNMIGRGRDTNLLVHANAHTTVNADGTVTTSFDHMSVECK